MKKDDYGSDVFRSLAMISQFGINMIVPILLCAGLGLFIDRKLGTQWVCIAGFFLGALAGFRNIYIFAKKIYSNPGMTKRQRERQKRRDTDQKAMDFLKRFFKMCDSLGELLVGIGVFGILCQAVIFVFFGKKLFYHSSGLWIGVIMAAAMAFHMAWSLDKALDLGASDAVKKMRMYSLIRYGCILIILGIMMITDKADPLAAFAGLMGLKAGAYMQPFLHKTAIKMGIKEPDPIPQPLPEEDQEKTETVGESNVR